MKSQITEVAEFCSVGPNTRWNMHLVEPDFQETELNLVGSNMREHMQYEELGSRKTEFCLVDSKTRRNIVHMAADENAKGAVEEVSSSFPRCICISKQQWCQDLEWQFRPFLCTSPSALVNCITGNLKIPHSFSSSVL